MKYLVLALALFGLLLAAPAPAADFYDGYTTAGGWTWHSGDGFWWKNGQAYTRQLVSTPGYYSYGCYYAGSSYWQYTAASYTPPAKKTVSYGPDWKSQILKVAAQRDDHAAYLQALKALGLPAPIDQGPVPGGTPYHLGRGPGYGLTGTGSSFQLSTFGANGSTLYGYQAATARDPYSTLDLNTVYQQAARLTQNAQTLAGQGHQDFSDLVKQAGTNQARVAEILAKAQAAEKVLKAAAGPAVTTQEQRTFQFQTTPGQAPAAAPIAAPPAPVGPLVPAPGSVPMMPRADAPKAAFQVLVQQKCASCHSGKKLEGGFDITAWPKLDAAARARVLARLTTTDASKRMPLGKTALAPEEIKLFLGP